MSCSALFYDGPLQSMIKEFDRETPPFRLYVAYSRTASVTIGETPRSTAHQCDYVRDVNPFPDGPRWIYMEAAPVAHEPADTA